MLKPHAVADVMTRDVVTVHRHTAFKDIVILLARHHISAVVVVDHARHVLGVVSEADLLTKESEQGSHATLVPRHRQARTKSTANRAFQLMTSPAVTITADQDITTAARALQRGGIKRLPVVDEHGALVGIVSRGDLLSVFLRTDNDIARDVTEQVLDGVSWADTASVGADVTDGVVVLRGRLERRSAIPVAVTLARRVEGVVDVIEHLAYSTDDTMFGPTPVNVDILHGLLPHRR